MTECNQQTFGFEAHISKQVTARFDGGQQTSDAGALLLRETNRRLNLLSRFAACFVDGRDSNRIEHCLIEGLLSSGCSTIREDSTMGLTYCPLSKARARLSR